MVDEGDIVGAYEEAWDRLRALYGEGTLPRTVNWISGPSRTADIEQTIIRGAHGPKTAVRGHLWTSGTLRRPSFPGLKLQSCNCFRWSRSFRYGASHAD